MLRAMTAYLYSKQNGVLEKMQSLGLDEPVEHFDQEIYCLAIPYLSYIF